MSNYIKDKIKKKMKESPLMADIKNSDVDALVSQATQTVAALPEATGAKAEAPVMTEAPVKRAPAKIQMHLAYNLYYDRKIKQYMLVTIEYNPKNLDYSRILSVKSYGDNMVVVNKKLSDMFALKLARLEEVVND